MTWTPSSELPNEEVHAWVKYRLKNEPTRIREEIIRLFNSKSGDPKYWLIEYIGWTSTDSFKEFYEKYELLAYCKIEKPGETTEEEKQMFKERKEKK